MRTMYFTSCQKKLFTLTYVYIMIQNVLKSNCVNTNNEFFGQNKLRYERQHTSQGKGRFSTVAS